MYQKLLELKNKRAQLLEQGNKLIAEKKFDEHKKLMDEEIETINREIDGITKQMAEEGRFRDNDDFMKSLHDDLKKQKEEDKQVKTLTELRASKEYGRAFLKAMAGRVTVSAARGNEAFNPLTKALSIGGGDPTGSEGGFLVPVEFDNAIVRLSKDYLALADLFNVEYVTRNSGWRAVETGTPKPLPNVDELGTIGKTDSPKFAKVAYNVKKFADRLPISNELLEDESAGLLEYVAQWFAQRYVLTQNSLLTPILTGLTKTVALPAGEEDKALRKALITQLTAADSRAATLLTNQSGYGAMAEWEDGDGRSMLAPDATNAMALRYRGRPVVYGDDTELTGSGLYVGNFKALGTLFIRKGIELATTSVGGDAWATDSTEVRAICRMDAQKVNGNAAFKATFGG